MSVNLSHGKQVITDGFGVDHAQLPRFEEGRLDPRQWFPKPGHPLEIEVGSGKGSFLIQQAPLAPAVNHLGIEQSNAYYRYAADRARRHGLENVRVLRADAVEFLRFWCADAVAAVIHLYFSDPWPKKRHHKRRVVQEKSLIEMARVLEPGGWLGLVTDHPDLWAWYEAHAARHADRFVREPFVPPASAGPGELVGSNYERKFARAGRPMQGMRLRRI